jgi:hypothetical protein
MVPIDPPLPGVNEGYPDWLILENMDVVVCDFLPVGQAVSQNSRIRRVTAAEYKALVNEERWRVDLLRLELRENSNKKQVFEVSNIFGPQGGHGYTIEIHKKIYGLRAEVSFLWIM